jgi:maltose O-acetyltransferase
MNSFLGTIFKNVSIGQAIRGEIEDDLSFMVRHLPGMLGFLSRYLVCKLLLKNIQSVPYIFPNVRMIYMNRISLGKRVLINSNTYVYGKGGVEIGDMVLISPNCSIVAGDHNFEMDVPILEQTSKLQKIIIEKNSWIGANVVILGGVTIREGSIIGAGAVVTKDTEPFSINLGIPAKKLRDRH